MCDVNPCGLGLYKIDSFVTLITLAALMMQKIHIASGADDHYFPGLLVCSDSAIARIDNGYGVVLHILDGGLSGRNYELLSEVLTGRHQDVELVRHCIDLTKFDSFNVSAMHTSAMAYARLLLPELVDAQRVIYLDSDIMVGRDLSDLWRRPFDEGKSVMVVRDPIIHMLKEDCPWDCSEAEGELPYFNSGLMVMDLCGWKKECIAADAFELISKDPAQCLYWDQTALNYILKGRVQYLESCWNTDARHVSISDFRVEGVNYHFLAHNKPWLGVSPFAPYLYYRKWLQRLLPDNYLSFIDIASFPEEGLLSRTRFCKFWIKNLICRWFRIGGDKRSKYSKRLAKHHENKSKQVQYMSGLELLEAQIEQGLSLVFK